MLARTHETNAHRRFRQALCGNRSAPHLNLSPSQWPCLTKSTPTPSSGNRFTTICGSNIPNGSSQMADVPSVILTSHALRNYSKISHERDPANVSPLPIASSNGHQAESVPAKSLRSLHFMKKQSVSSFALFLFAHFNRTSCDHEYNEKKRGPDTNV